MARVGMLLALILALAAPAEARRQPLGVFAKINGKRFRAPSTGDPNDSCVRGLYVANGGITLAAGECRGRGHRRRERRNPKVLALACGVLLDVNEPPAVPPFDAPCLLAGYSEFRSGRFGIPVSMKQWLSTVNVVDEQSAVRIRIDSFDGTIVRGAFFGVFDLPQPPATGQAVISGEGRFAFPVMGISR